MKNFLKNTVIIFLIIFFILSLLNLMSQIFQHYYVVTPEIIELAELVSSTGISAEDSYKTLSSIYAAGYGGKIEIQITIILIAFLLSIAIGLIYTFEENSKIKMMCYYILGIVLVSLIPSLFNIFYYEDFNIISFLDDILYYFKSNWIWYTLIFVIFYIIKIIISNKKVQELNKTLENKLKIK